MVSAKKNKSSAILIEVFRISASLIKENEGGWEEEDTYSFFDLVILFLKIER